MVESISRDGDWRGALFDGARSLLLPLDANGAALLFEGRVQTIGETPGTEQISARSRDGCGRSSTDGFYATASLAAEAPAVRALTDVAAGVVGGAGLRRRQTNC